MRLFVCLLSFMCLTILAVLPEDEGNNAEDDRARPAQHGLHRVPAMLDLSAMRAPDGTEVDEEDSDDERVGAVNRQLTRRGASFNLGTGIRPANHIARRPESAPARRRSRLGGVSARPGVVEVVMPMPRAAVAAGPAAREEEEKKILAEAQRRAAADIAKYLQKIAEKERKRQRAAAAEQARQEEAAAAHADFAGEEAVEGDSDDDYTDVEDPEFQRALEELCRNRQD